MGLLSFVSFSCLISPLLMYEFKDNLFTGLQIQHFNFGFHVDPACDLQSKTLL